MLLFFLVFWGCWGVRLFCIFFFFFCMPAVKYVIHVYVGTGTTDQIPHAHSMVAKRSHTNRANIHTPI